jgi:hypothetical protein
MTLCEWGDDGCKKQGTFTVMLKGSNSASNIFFACWQHVKPYRKKKFVEDSFGKGAQVEILHIGKGKP